MVSAYEPEPSAPALVAPFPWFGGKSSIAPEVWARLGDVTNYVEPFFGSGAVLLARPADHAPRTETVNDKDGFVSNFWRAVRAEPEAVADHADWPVNENDLHARHAWLVARADDLTRRLEGDPAFYDAKIAGWWVWGACSWIGSGWCSGRGPWRVVDGELVNAGNAGMGINRQLPHLGNAGMGINRQLPHLGNAGMGINRQLPHLGDAGRGDSRAYIMATMAALSARLRRVRVASGDWRRVTGPSVTSRHGLTGVFLDPPYSHEERQSDLYRQEMALADEVREWAIEQGRDPLMRIVLCGYEDEHAMPEGWRAVPWKARGGYGSQGNGAGRANAAREVLWCSPHCLAPHRRAPQLSLFMEANQ